MKMVNIKCEIDTTAGSIEEALDEIREHLVHLQYAAINPNLANDYRKWDEKNEGDVDWTPFSVVTERSRSEIWIKNV